MTTMLRISELPADSGAPATLILEGRAIGAWVPAYAGMTSRW